MPFTSLTKLAALAVLSSTVAGHGYVTNVTVAGTTYSGYLPYLDPYYSPVPSRIVRPVQGNGPIDDLNLIDLQCGGYTAGGIIGTTPAKLHAGPVAAGSDVSLDWTLWPESHKGPVITYMAKCPDTNCSSYLPGTDTVWFKIKEGGRDGTSDTWASTALMTAPSQYTYTIPSCLEAGYYIVRHEIIALHTASVYPGAQSFPSCHQLQVTGSGTSAGPTTKVAFPGAYNASDPGITYDITKATTYTIPGPAVFTCDGSSSSGNSSSSSSSATSSSVASSVASTSTAISAAVKINAAANNSTPTTLLSSVRSTSTGTLTAASSVSTSKTEDSDMPAGTTLEDLITWISNLAASL